MAYVGRPMTVESESLRSATPVSTAMGRRRRLERVWLGMVVSWSLVRIVAVWQLLEQYGVHPGVYAVVDLGSSVPYAIASARTLGALVDRRYRHGLIWGVLAATCFVLPDLYIVTSGRGMPWGVYAVVATVALTAGTWAVRAGWRDLATERRAEALVVDRESAGTYAPADSTRP